MMTREEFNRLHLPIVNKAADIIHGPRLVAEDLDGLWHNYLLQEAERAALKNDANP